MSWAVQSVMCLRENIPYVHLAHSARSSERTLFQRTFSNANFGSRQCRKQPPVITSRTCHRIHKYTKNVSGLDRKRRFITHRLQGQTELWNPSQVRTLAGCRMGRAKICEFEEIQHDVHENKIQRRPLNMEVKNGPTKVFQVPMRGTSWPKFTTNIFETVPIVLKASFCICRIRMTKQGVYKVCHVKSA